MRTPDYDTLMRRVLRDEDECWIWQGAVDGRGYGNIGRSSKGESKNWIVHRLMYELVWGPIPEAHDIHHTCEKKLCLRPDHLEAVTRKEHHGVGGRHPDHPAKARAARGWPFNQVAVG